MTKAQVSEEIPIKSAVFEARHQKKGTADVTQRNLREPWFPFVLLRVCAVRVGKSLVPAFTEERSIERNYLWWYHDGNRAIRVKDWKLVATNDGVWELFDLAKDRTETRDLASKQSDKVKKLEKLWLDAQNQFIKDANLDHSSKKKK